MGFKIKKWKGSVLGAVASAVTMNPLPLAAGAYYDLSKQQTEKQNKANQAAIDRANAYDMYTWDLANQYNDPKQQMARLKAAGLNPNLVYGSGSVTGNTTGTAGSNGVASQEAFSAMGAIQKGLPLAQGLANLRNTNTQNELLKYQQGQTQAQTDSIIAHTNYLPQQMEYLSAQQHHMQQQDAIMSHNLQWAQEHDMPVGYVPDWQKDAYNTVAGWIKNRFKDKGNDSGKIGNYEDFFLP